MKPHIPYVWTGGKRRIAAYVWQRLGNVTTYIEPFAGGAAMFGLRPEWHWNEHPLRREVLNDANGFIVNFLRAVQFDPIAVGYWADNPILESDLHARHIWLVNQRSDLTARIEGDPLYYDVKIAGWWVWGLNNWLSVSEWCVENGSWNVQSDGLFANNNPLGVKRSIPRMGHSHGGFQAAIRAMSRDGYWTSLQERFRRSVVKVLAGSWERTVTPACTIHSGDPIGIFFDPPMAMTAMRSIPTIRQQSTAMLQHGVFSMATILAIELPFVATLGTTKRH